LLDGPEGRPLRLALDDVYRAFASVRLDETFAVCPHCFTDDDRDYLLETALLDLTWSDIAFILGKAVTTLGSARDFGYFLPRILEGFALGVHYLPHVAPAKILRSHEAGWTAAQVAAVADFVNALEVIVYAMPDDDPERADCRDFVASLRNRLG